MPDYIPFALPEIGEDEINEVVDTLKSGWITTGPKTRKFEEDFASYIGVKHALALNSCTAGLHLALEALGIGNNDLVIVPVYTFSASAAVAHYLQAETIFIDIEPISLNISPSKLKEFLKTNTTISSDGRCIHKQTYKTIKAMIIVHYAGEPAEMNELLSISKLYNIDIIEDAAHALPAKYRTQGVGTFGSLSAFSFYATKTITTAEGGMLVTDDNDLADRIRVMRLHGMSKDAWKRYDKGGSWFYEVVAPGYKYNMTDLQASLGIHQLKKANIFQKKREAIAMRYNDAFKRISGLIIPYHDPENLHSWHLYCLRIAESMQKTRDNLIDHLTEKGIGTSVHFIPLHLHPFYRDKYGLKPEDYPEAYKAFKGAVSLPIYTKLNDESVDYIIETVTDFFK